MSSPVHAEEVEEAEQARLWALFVALPPAEQADEALEALVAHSLTLLAEMPPAEAAASVLAGIASHAMSEASRLRDELAAQRQMLKEWQEAQAAALQNPRMMRLHAPGAGFMSTRDFAKRLSEAGLQQECGPQTGAAQHVYHIIANASESPCRLFLSCPHSPMPYSLSHRWRARSR